MAIRDGAWESVIVSPSCRPQAGNWPSTSPAFSNPESLSFVTSLCVQAPRFSSVSLSLLFILLPCLIAPYVRRSHAMSKKGRHRRTPDQHRRRWEVAGSGVAIAVGGAIAAAFVSTGQASADDLLGPATAMTPSRMWRRRSIRAPLARPPFPQAPFPRTPLTMTPSQHLSRRSTGTRLPRTAPPMTYSELSLAKLTRVWQILFLARRSIRSPRKSSARRLRVVLTAFS